MHAPYFTISFLLIRFNILHDIDDDHLRNPIDNNERALHVNPPRFEVRELLNGINQLECLCKAKMPRLAQPKMNHVIDHEMGNTVYNFIHSI